MLRTIGKRAFCGCSGLKIIAFPEGLEEIGVRAFEDSGLESVTFPSSVRTVHQTAFCRCQNLRKAVLNEGLEVLGTDEHSDDDFFDELCGVFQRSAVERVELPSTLKRIEYRAFKKCADLKEIILPERLEYIGDYCFYDSGLEEITLPGALKEVGDGLFTRCELLRTVWLEGGCEIDVGECVDDGVNVRRK